MKKVRIKEIKRWMKTLEENRYKRIVGADANRVTWFINNNMSEEGMPPRIAKTWEHTQYGKEKYLAQRYIDEVLSKKENISESVLRKLIRKEIKRLGKKVQKA